MTTVILSGPALAIGKSDAKYLALMDVDSRAILCTVMFAPNTSKTLQLSLGSNLSSQADVLGTILFLQALGKQYQKAPIVLTDTDALVFAMAMSTAMLSKDTTLTNALATMTFVLEATVEPSEDNVRTYSVRFEGMNIAGVKQLAKATDLTLTINVNYN